MEPGITLKHWRWQVLCFFSLWGWGSGQLRYSVVEESVPGTFVGNVAEDLGLSVAAISERRLGLGSQKGKRYFALDLSTGALVVHEKIDRERLCGSSSSCLLSEEVVVENPLELFRLEVNVLDINDNAPSFISAHRVVRITELVATPGARFSLESAQDPDVGANSIKVYRLNPNPYFSLSLKHRKDGTLFPELVLDKVLDREEQAEHQLILTAIDGGNPAKSGSTQITITVVDVNDNAPVFDHAVYKVALKENSPVDTLLIKLNATDRDAGRNGDIEYSFDEYSLDSVQNIFSLNPHTGEIRVQGTVDFEVASFYEISIRAKDHGVPELEGQCAIHVTIEDTNDNAAELMLNSLVDSVPENTPVGTAVGLFRVTDRDSGPNGEVRLELSPNLPFQLKSFENHYSLITSDILDRERVSQYTIQLTATDLGSPSLQTRITISLNISDVNDNPPRFSQIYFNAYIKENNEPGSLLCTLSASDPDEGDNSHLTYSIMGSHVEGLPVSSFIYMNPHTGNITAQRAFDYESVQVLQISVLVEDDGSPKLSSNATVNIFVLDENDNAPSLLYPVTSKELIAQEKIPRSVPMGYLVSKVTAVDPDSGHNAWLYYSLLESTDNSLFRVAPRTGEIRTTRSFKDTDSSDQRLVILVKDNGQPALSTTVTILIFLENTIYEKEPIAGEFHKQASYKSEMTQYLIISLVVISLISLVTFMILFARCLRKGSSFNSSLCCPTRSQSGNFPKHLRPTLQLNTDGTLKYVEVSLGPTEPQNQCYKTCFTPVSESSEFTFMRPLNFPQLKGMVNGTDTLPPITDGLGDPDQVRYYSILS